MSTEIKYISPSHTKTLRHLVLRPGKAKYFCDWEGDELKSTKHLGAFIGSRCIGVLSLFRSTTTEFQNKNQYQLRGMAIHPDFQQKGIGKQLVIFSESELKKLNVDILWCNARTTAVNFYKKLKFDVFSKEFQIENSGPHYLMAKNLQ